jgi:hypothetical protein
MAGEVAQLIARLVFGPLVVAIIPSPLPVLPEAAVHLEVSPSPLRVVVGVEGAREYAIRVPSLRRPACISPRRLATFALFQVVIRVVAVGEACFPEPVLFAQVLVKGG